MRTFVLSMFWLYIVLTIVIMISIKRKGKVKVVDLVGIFLNAIVICWASILLW